MRRGGSIEVSPVMAEKVDDGGAGVGDKEKKKNKRRSNRRSKQNSQIPASSLGNEICGESLQTSGTDVHPLNEHGPNTASNIAFKSMPSMHLIEQTEQLLPSDRDGSFFAKSCHEPIASGGLFGKYANKYTIPSHFEGCAQGEIFTPYWSMDAVNEALEKGDAFKASFHVNAHNRFEAYCRIEGVPVDVLINGIAAQNRAVEGDIVIVKVDALSYWAKMKGSNAPSNKFSTPENENTCLEANGSCSNVEANETASGSYKGKNKVVVDNVHTDCGSFMLPSKGLDSMECAFAGDTEPNERMGYNNRYHPSAADCLQIGSSLGKNEILDGVRRICAMISSYPSKRPTGRVVAIKEKSSRRDAIIGFLNVTQWCSYREGCKKGTNGSKSSLSISNGKYIELMPTDPKFPKMMVYVSGLPDCIRKRLEDDDATVQMELVAAQIDNWDEESPFPQAHVLHVFGRGSEMEAQINAILYENAVSCSDFSPEALSCIPGSSWEVPPEEFQSREDLRNLCIFTIDPSTATDLDDALSVESLPNGIVRVGVHIADASYFVLPDTALDIEAQLRSTTVYMLQRKLPMLPPLLSGNICSLNPGVDRLAFSIFWDFSDSGRVLHRWIGRTVIRSCCKLSYEQAHDIIGRTIDEESYNSLGDGLPQLHGHFEWPEIVRSVRRLHDISKILREKRFNDGALLLENAKVCFLFDECGVPCDSMVCEQKDSNFLVEEFMLLANMTAAEVISRAFPGGALLRRHPEPNMRKLREFEAFCSKHGLELDTSSSGHFHWSLEHIKEKLKDDRVLYDILIYYASRPMQSASYFCSGDLKNNMNDWGHYTLGVPLYTHFTSPLRRYPDIVVHRILAATIEAEVLYMKHRGISLKMRRGEEAMRCFTGICFNKDAAESLEGREALSIAATRHRVPCTELLERLVAHCNERKLASRHVKDACDKLYMWVLLKKKELLLSEARVLGLGPRFMSVYIQKLAIERRIYYDEVEGLTVEWLEATSALVLNLCAYKRSRRAGFGHYRALDDVAMVIKPYDLEFEPGMSGECAIGHGAMHFSNTGTAAQYSDPIAKPEIDPVVSPLTVRLLSTIPVVLHAVGGDDGPVDIGVRLFLSSYFS